MTDEPAQDAAAVPEQAPVRAHVGSSPRRRFDALPVLYLLGFLVLAGALFYLWRHPQTVNVAQATGQVETLQQQLQGLNGRVGQLENRPAPAAPSLPQDLTALQTQVAALSKQVAELSNRPATVQAGTADLAPLQSQLGDLQRQIVGLAGQLATIATRPAPAPPDLGPLVARVNALESRPSVDLGPLTARVNTLEGRPPVDLGPLTAQVAGIETRGRADSEQINGKLAALDKAGHDLGGKIDAVSGRVDALEPRLAAAEAQGKQTAGALTAMTERSQRAARLQAAAVALQTGQKLGAIPAAPPALARFATDPPPTDSQLRLSFNGYADAAMKASQPAASEDKPFAERLWNRAQQVVTVRQGDRVLVGDPVSGVLAHARADLDAGDLKAAVDTLADLNGPAAAAMAPWVDQARALLDARVALANMAAG